MDRRGVDGRYGRIAEVGVCHVQAGPHGLVPPYAPDALVRAPGLVAGLGTLPPRRALSGARRGVVRLPASGLDERFVVVRFGLGTVPTAEFIPLVYGFAIPMAGSLATSALRIAHNTATTARSAALHTRRRQNMPTFSHPSHSSERKHPAASTKNTTNNHIVPSSIYPTRAGCVARSHALCPSSGPARAAVPMGPAGR
jgi:hypothetical protein